MPLERPYIFISKFNSNLSKLLASTYIGVGRYLTCNTSIAIDKSGNIFIAGTTKGELYNDIFPTTPGAYDATYDRYHQKDEGFVSKLNSDLSKLLHSTFIGGSGEDVCKSIALDGKGNVYVTGFTSSKNYPTAPVAYDKGFAPDDPGYRRAVISKFNPNLSTLLASTYFGGSDGHNEAFSIAVGRNGDVYIAGITRALTFPTTEGIYDVIFDGYGGIFVSKFDSDLSRDLQSPIASEIRANGLNGPVNITSNENLSITIQLSPGGFAGKNVDWWLVEAAPSGLSHYLPVDGSWASGLTYSHQGPLFNLGEFEVLNISGLPAGSYTFYFGVDLDMNGLLDMDEAYYDFVTVNIQ